MTTATDSTIDLDDGYKIQILTNDEGITFTVRDATNREVAIDVAKPLSAKRSYWRGDWDPSRDKPEYSRIEFGRYGRQSFTPKLAKATAVALDMAAAACNSLNEEHAEALAHQEHERREYKQREEREEREHAERVNKVKEELQHYLGQNFKLKREGYKATVFGTVERFSDTHVYTISERGVPMDTLLDSIYFFAIKYEGEKRYTTVYEREPRHQ